MNRYPRETSWLDEYLKDPANAVRFEEEGALIEVSEQLLRALDASSLRKADLAEQLGTSRANVTQMLTGRRNLTVRTVARLAYYLGQRLHVALQPLHDERQFRDIPMPSLAVRSTTPLPWEQDDALPSGTDTYAIAELGS